MKKLRNMRIAESKRTWLQLMCCALVKELGVHNFGSCGKRLREMRMIYAESKRGIMIAGGALFNYKLGSCHEASRI